MADLTRNKLSAKLIKAEMLNDAATVNRLKAELAQLPPITNLPSTNGKSVPTHNFNRGLEIGNKGQAKRAIAHNTSDNKVKKFIQSNNSLTQMFTSETHLTASDEARLFLKTSSIFSKEDMETKYFSKEIDDSQKVLSKRHKSEPTRERSIDDQSDVNRATCSRCYDRRPKHLIIDSTLPSAYMTIMSNKPLFSSLSNVIIINNDHSCGSFIAASDEHQIEVEIMIKSLKDAWKSKGYSCVITETYYRDHRPAGRELISCSNHFQIHCIPIREKYLEKTKMCYMQALQAIGNDWSMNRKIIKIDGSRIQRYLPKGLSYFWVCFNDLKNGLGHVIESEKKFSRYFGFEVLSGSIGKEFNQMKLSENENFNNQFERSRDFKLLYSNFRQSK